jgi:hypothetical protein
MACPRCCNLYSASGEPCECDTTCGNRHEECPQDIPINTEQGEVSPASVTQSYTDEFEEPAENALDSDRKYHEFIERLLARSTSDFTVALSQYLLELNERNFTHEDQEVLEEFRKIVELAKGEVEMVDIYEFAETVREIYLLATEANELAAAAKRYRVVFQSHEGKVRVDEDILRNLLILLAKASQEGCEAKDKA